MPYAPARPRGKDACSVCSDVEKRFHATRAHSHRQVMEDPCIRLDLEA